MIRKKRRGQVSHDRWLVSYADFITLLFAFFVVLFATGQSDKQKKVELAASIQSAFNQMGIFDSHLALQPSTKLIGSGGSAVPPIVSTPLAPTVESMVIVRQRIEETARADIASGVIAIHQSESGMVISLQEAGFFESGAADIRPSALQVLYRIAAVLPESSLRVEGHTDNIPINTPRFASNWELSSSRASSIARLLLLHSKVHPEQMSVAGYAEFHPVASNATLEGRARNRRVDLVLLLGPNGTH
jgi:chemotaxis protein MotB